MSERSLQTIGEIAATLECPAHRVDYAIRRHGIRETRRAGIIRLFDAASVERIERAITRIKGIKP